MIVGEEKQFVPQERTADGAAKDVARVLGLCSSQTVRRPRRCRERIVAPVVEPVSTNLVRAGLDHHVDDGAGDVAKLR